MKFSIVTISYNQGRFLERAIQSVVSQRADGIDLEYVVVDGGSTDGSLDTIELYRTEIDRVIVGSDDGPAAGLNNGFRVSSGDVLGFLNSDDLLEPGSLREVREFFELNPDADAVVGGLRIVDEFDAPLRWGSLMASKVQLPVPFSAQLFLERRTVVLQQSTFFRRRAWTSAAGFNESNRTCWDAELFVDMALAGISFHRIRPILASFRIHDESITGSPVQDAQREIDRSRIQIKVEQMGYVTPSAIRGVARRVGWRARPVHRYRQILAGR